MDKFCLKWNDFQSNISNSFSKLRNEDEFYDVTLVSDDQKQISAHKVVLSASSEYFRTILKHNKHPHPLLCLEGISSSELNNILDYFYNGEVNIYQDDLDRFLNIAERYKLEGLLGDNKLDNGEKNDIQNDDEMKRPIYDTKNNLVDLIDDSDNKPMFRQETKVVINSEQFPSLKELEEKISEHLEKDASGKGWKCNICGKVVRDKTAGKEHVEIHFDGLSFPCQDCNVVLRSRHSLRQNTLRFHKQTK